MFIPSNSCFMIFRVSVSVPDEMLESSSIMGIKSIQKYLVYTVDFEILEIE